MYFATPENVVINQADNTLIITVGSISNYVKINSTLTVKFNNLSNVKYNVSSFGVNNIGICSIDPNADITPK